MKQRRGPCSKLPAAIAQHGFVSDLVAAVGAAAAEHGRTMSVHKKNGDYYLAVLVPDSDELAVIDAMLDLDAMREGGDR